MKKCSACGVEVQEAAKFCKACGGKLSGSDASFNDKKARVVGKEKTWIKPVAIAAAVVAFVGAMWLAKGVYASKKMGGRPMFSSMRDASVRVAKATAVKAEGDHIRIAVDSIADGNAHFFAFTTGGKTVTFFAVKSADGTIRTALDACVACNHAKLGYRQEGGLVVCNNCGMGFQPNDIGAVTGGCNPIPVNRSIEGGMIVLKVKDLESGVQYF